MMQPAEFRPLGLGKVSEFRWDGADHYQGNGVGDTSTFRYDAVLKRYVFDGKYNLYLTPEKILELGLAMDPKPRLRLRTFSESDDLIHWSSPRFLMFPDRLDPPDRQIYAHVGFVYESKWIGIIQTMRFHATGWKQTDLSLSYSRDGRHWLRPRERQPFIPWAAPPVGTPITQLPATPHRSWWARNCSFTTADRVIPTATRIRKNAGRSISGWPSCVGMDSPRLMRAQRPAKC
jgi:hypothetical protein